MSLAITDFINLSEPEGKQTRQAALSRSSPGVGRIEYRGFFGRSIKRYAMKQLHKYSGKIQKTFVASVSFNHVVSEKLALGRERIRSLDRGRSLSKLRHLSGYDFTSSPARSSKITDKIEGLNGVVAFTVNG